MLAGFRELRLGQRLEAAVATPVLCCCGRTSEKPEAAVQQYSTISPREIFDQVVAAVKQ